MTYNFHLLEFCNFGFTTDQLPSSSTAATFGKAFTQRLLSLNPTPKKQEIQKIQCLPITFRSTASGSVGGRSYTPQTSVFYHCLMENIYRMSTKIAYVKFQDSSQLKKYLDHLEYNHKTNWFVIYTKLLYQEKFIKIYDKRWIQEKQQIPASHVLPNDLLWHLHSKQYTPESFFNQKTSNGIISLYFHRKFSLYLNIIKHCISMQNLSKLECAPNHFQSILRQTRRTITENETLKQVKHRNQICVIYVMPLT